MWQVRFQLEMTWAEKINQKDSGYLTLSLSFYPMPQPPSPSLFLDKKFPALGLIPSFRSKFGDWTFI
jgi:hypothetical protein